MDQHHSTLTGFSDALFALFIAWILWFSDLEAVLRPAETSALYAGAVILLGIRLLIGVNDLLAARNRKRKSELDLRNSGPLA